MVTVTVTVTVSVTDDWRSIKSGKLGKKVPKTGNTQFRINWLSNDAFLFLTAHTCGKLSDDFGAKINTP